MSGASSIEWTDATWNPVRGCSRVSDGCRNCYAERIAARFSDELAGGGRGTMAGAQAFHGFARQTPAGPRWTGKVELVPSALDWPLRWRGAPQARAEGRPSRIFVNSMSDLFHEKLSDEEIAAVFGVMAASQRHVFQVLTKRPERARRWFEQPRTVEDCVVTAVRRLDTGIGCRMPAWPLSNVWLGTSVEDQETADERIPHLLACPAAVRFVSYEPALGAVDFRPWLRTAPVVDLKRHPSEGLSYTPALRWIIVGGESGPGARSFDLAWARSAVEQCSAADVACFVKQLGAFPFEFGHDDDLWCRRPPPDFEGEQWFQSDVKITDRKGGEWSEWPEELRVREFPAARAAEEASR